MGELFFFTPIGGGIIRVGELFEGELLFQVVSGRRKRHIQAVLQYLSAFSLLTRVSLFNLYGKYLM